MKKSYKAPFLECQTTLVVDILNTSGITDYDNNQKDTIDYSLFE